MVEIAIRSGAAPSGPPEPMTTGAVVGDGASEPGVNVCGPPGAVVEDAGAGFDPPAAPGLTTTGSGPCGGCEDGWEVGGGVGGVGGGGAM